MKIDHSFIKEIETVSEASAIVRAVTDLATSFGMGTTAERVETEAQRIALSKLNCTEIQGYLISRPLPRSEIDRVIGGGSDTAREAA